MSPCKQIVVTTRSELVIKGGRLTVMPTWAYAGQQEKLEWLGGWGCVFIHPPTCPGHVSYALEIVTSCRQLGLLSFAHKQRFWSGIYELISVV